MFDVERGSSLARVDIGGNLVARCSRWLGSTVVGRRTRDREVAGSTPDRCTAG